MKRIYCLALVMSLAVGCKSEDALDGTSDRLGIEWVSVEGGSFLMGSSEVDLSEWITSVHRVTVIPFEITKTEVTVAQYRTCVDAGRCSEPKTGGDCNWNVGGRENHPINCVNWGQARTFAKWVGADVDLPTEAEWEYAARGGQDFIYAGSNNSDEVAWYAQDPEVFITHPVGTKQANGYGLYDMSGNVSEWVLDEWHGNYEGAPTVSNEAWGEVLECGQVCDTGSAGRVAGYAGRVNRGGGCGGGVNDVRVTSRQGSWPDNRVRNVGFRLRRTR